MPEHPHLQSPKTPPRHNLLDRDLTLGPAKREVSFFQRRRNPFNVAIPFHFPPASSDEIRQRRSDRLRVNIDDVLLELEKENDLQLDLEEPVEEVKKPAVFEPQHFAVENKISEIEKRREKRKRDLQKHVDRLKQAENLKQGGGFLNMPDNIRIQQQYPKNFGHLNKELDKMIKLAAVAGAVKKQAARQKPSNFVSSFEERQRIRNQIALRQIQKFKKEAVIPSRHKFVIPSTQQIDSDDEENEENELTEREIKISTETICQGFQRMNERGLTAL